MDIFKIPLTPDAQIFDIYLGGQHYNIRLYYNADMKLWVIDITDFVEQKPLINGIPVVTGCDLLGQYRYLGFSGSLTAYTNDSDEPPSYDNLGVDGNLYFVTGEY